MKLKLEDARRLMEAALAASGYDAGEVAIIADHLMDCELRGLGYAGLARAVTIIEHDRRSGLVRRPISVTHETPVSARLDGGDDLGYLVAMRATDMAIAKARQSGIAIVGASRTHFTGMYSHYLEKVTAAGLVGMIAGSGPSGVAPFGGTEPRFSTNPIAFGFPSNDVPVIWDITTSSITHAEVSLAKRLWVPLPEGRGYDADGSATTDPAKVLAGGAMAVWGGHRGSGLALSVQLLSMMAGQQNAHGPYREPGDFGYLIMVVDPALFGPADAFRSSVSAYADEVRRTRPVDPGTPVRVPFERSARIREETLAAGHIEVTDAVVETLRGFASER
jgi:LDH2 family malate/lactate/ureidoglycolate dehydrogenase